MTTLKEMRNSAPQFDRKPSWIKVRPPGGKNYNDIKDMLKGLNLATVCQEAHCPNMEECWGGGTATFMLMGDTCTRACKFCAVKTGNPEGILDIDEPQKVGNAISKMKLDYVVLTSVDRDDLADFGSEHFAKTIRTIKMGNPKMIIEVLTPDFGGRKELVEHLLKSKPDVFAHNIEVVKRLTHPIRDRRASYETSINVLKMAKDFNPKQYTKTSVMLGLGESMSEVIETMKDLRQVGCDVITFGQYLAPSSKHAPVMEYISPEIFKDLETKAMEMGFLYCASGPLVRSSYRAGEFFIKGIIEKNRLNERTNHPTL